MDGSSTLGAPQETLEAAIYKTTITRVVPKCSTCGCYCQTKKSQREGIHHICDAQHKKPLCSALSKTKVARGKQKVSGAGRTLWSKMLNVWKVGGGTTRYQQTCYIARTHGHLPSHPSDFFPKDPKTCFSLPPFYYSFTFHKS